MTSDANKKLLRDLGTQTVLGDVDKFTKILGAITALNENKEIRKYLIKIYMKN